MRLIDAEALKDCFCKGPPELIYTHVVLGMIDDAPTVYAKPVRHGRWVTEWTGEIMIVDGVKSELGMVRCSICGGDQVKEIYKYCPWCGAKMDGGET